MPFMLPVGTTSHPVLGDPLPDVFGSSTGFMSSKPYTVDVPVVSKPPSNVNNQSTGATAFSANSSPNSQAVEEYTDEDDLSVPDESASPEGTAHHAFA